MGTHVRVTSALVENSDARSRYIRCDRDGCNRMTPCERVAQFLALARLTPFVGERECRR